MGTKRDEVITPPTTPIARGYNRHPIVSCTIRGRKPTIVVDVVIKIGRKRCDAASSIISLESLSDLPQCFKEGLAQIFLNR